MTCGWTLDYAPCDSSWDELPEADRAAVKAAAEHLAVELLWSWTGRVFGVCPVTVRPCRGCGGGSTFEGTLNMECGRCLTRACTCGDDLRAILLPGPVQSVTQVLIDGQLLAPMAYRVDRRRILQRTDGEPWPTCQDVALNDTEPGTWSVTYERGVPVPVGGQVAAAALAVQLGKALCHDTTCELPQRVQSITRQGVTMAVLDEFADVEKGRTGLWLVDSWVASVINPRRPSTIASPDYRPMRRTP